MQGVRPPSAPHPAATMTLTARGDAQCRQPGCVPRCPRRSARLFVTIRPPHIPGVAEGSPDHGNRRHRSAALSCPPLDALAPEFGSGCRRCRTFATRPEAVHGRAVDDDHGVRQVRVAVTGDRVRPVAFRCQRRW